MEHLADFLVRVAAALAVMVLKHFFEPRKAKEPPADR